MYMRYLLTVALSLMMASMSANTPLRVVDNEDSSPVAHATVFGKSGVIIGMTDENGVVDIPIGDDFPVTVKCLGYEAAACGKSEKEVRLKHALFSLGEVVVTPVARPVVRLLCYVREYVSGATATDTMMCYNEHMADFFLAAENKIKGFKAQPSPRFLCSRLYSRIKNASGVDSIFIPAYRDDIFCWENMVEIPSGCVSETEKIRSGAKLDSIPGKHGIKHRLRKNDLSTYVMHTDYLADSKSHRISPFIFKLLGLSIDFNELQGSWAYRCNDKGVYTPADIVSGTFSLSVTAKGKWIRKALKSPTPVGMYSFYEIYPVEVEYLTVEEAKDLLYDNPPRVSMAISPHAGPLDPAVRSMVDGCGKKADS